MSTPEQNEDRYESGILNHLDLLHAVHGALHGTAQRPADESLAFDIATQQTLHRPSHLVQSFVEWTQAAPDFTTLTKRDETATFCIDALDSVALPPEERAQINVFAVIHKSNVKRMADRIEKGIGQNAQDWDNDTFESRLTDEQLKDLSDNSALYGDITGGLAAPVLPETRLRIAHYIVDAFAIDPGLQKGLRSAIDPAVFKTAVECATRGFDPLSDFSEAHELIRTFSSDRVRRLEMRSALDKYTFSTAEAMLDNGVEPKEVRMFIIGNSSTSPRRVAMLERLRLYKQ